MLNERPAKDPIRSKKASGGVDFSDNNPKGQAYHNHVSCSNWETFLLENPSGKPSSGNQESGRIEE